LIQIIESSGDSGDGVSIGREHPMTNTELTLDQLQTINGGRVTMCGRVHTFLKPKIGGTSGPGGTSYPVAKGAGSSAIAKREQSLYCGGS